MFFQDTPPDTSAYMIAGYTVFFLVMAIYLVSLFVRSRNLRQDLEVLENMEQENRPAAVEPVMAKPRVRGATESRAPASKRKIAAKTKQRK